MDGIAHALLGRVVEANGDVVVGRRVIAIQRRGDHLVVVTDDGSEYSAPSVACNLSPSDLLSILDEGAVPDEYRAQVAQIRASGNAHQFKLALKRPLVSEGCIIGGASNSNVGLGDLSISLMEAMVADIEAGKIPDPIPIYAPVPSNYDPSLAPQGRQLIVASVYGPKREDPADPPEKWREQGLAALATMIPGLMDELMFVDFTPVPLVGRWMGKRGNGAICNGQFPGQVGRDRLPVSTPIPGLFLCGDGAGGRGIGTELAATSAMETARAIAQWHANARRRFA
jgi:prolycopene isomerase